MKYHQLNVITLQPSLLRETNKLRFFHIIFFIAQFNSNSPDTDCAGVLGEGSLVIML